MIDSVFTFIQYALLVLAGFLFFGWLGFKIPASKRKPAITADEQGDSIAAPIGSLPPHFSRYLAFIHPLENIKTGSITAWGKGRIRSDLPVIGSMWLPITWELHLKPGEAFTWRVVVTWFNRPYLKGGDSFSGEQGMYKMGSEILETEFITKSEITNLWMFSILFSPNLFTTLKDLTWQVVDDSTVWLKVPSPTPVFDQFKLFFDEGSSRLLKIDTQRITSRDGTLLEFHTKAIASSSFDGVGVLPSQIEFAWDSSPYLKLTVNGICHNTAVDQEIENGI